MRSKCRNVFVMLAGVLALSAVASASASAALPEFQKGGKGLEKAVTFTEKSGEVVFENKIDNPVVCSASSATGETHGVKEVEGVVVKSTGCHVLFGSSHVYCASTGAKEGEIVTAKLSGKLGYLEKTPVPRVGLLLEQSKGEKIAECKGGSGEANVKIKGSVIGQIGVLNKETTSFYLKFIKNNTIGYQQEPLHFEGEETIHKLEMVTTGGPNYEETALQAEFGITSGEAIEIKA